MNPEVKFLETLKALGFPNINKYSAANFESYFTDPQLYPFLEFFSSFDENNVLSSEEIDEYAAITPEEMKILEELASTESEVVVNHKEKEQVEILTEKLNHLERKCSSLEGQRKTLLEHEAFILKEKTNCEDTNRSLRRLLDDFSINKVPQCIAQLSSTLESVSAIISKLGVACNIVNDENMVLPSLNLREIEEYFREEEKLSNLVLANLLKDFQFEDEDKTILSIPGFSKQDISREIHIMKNSLKVSKICESKSVCNSIKADKTVLLVNKFQNGYFDGFLEMSPAQLRCKFTEATKLNECLKKKEAMLLSYLSDVIRAHVDAQGKQIALAHSNEIRLIYKNSLDDISHPLQYMLNQEARLVLLNLLISIHYRQWQDIKDLIEEVFCFGDSEKKSCLLRRQKVEEFMKQAKVEETHLNPDSIFFSAYKILNGDSKNLITLSDVVKCIEKLSEKKELISKITKENNEVIEALAKQYSDLEKVISNGTDYDALMKVESNFSIKINQVEVLLNDIFCILRVSENEWKEKNKLLFLKKNLKLARNLFIYALLERERFEHIVESIEGARQHLS